MADQGPLYEAILTGNMPVAQEATQAAIDGGSDPEQLVQEQMIPAMDEVGRRFEANEYFVPELLISARAMETALGIITPHLVASGVEAAGRVVIGTVKGDLHDIGKNLVNSMLKGAGFEVIDLGVDVPTEKFVEEVKKEKGTILALSSLLTTTMGVMKQVIDALETEGIRDETKVMIGGAPVTQDFADDIGADGYSDNASAAVALARTLTGK